MVGLLDGEAIAEMSAGEDPDPLHFKMISKSVGQENLDPTSHSNRP